METRRARVTFWQVSCAEGIDAEALLFEFSQRPLLSDRVIDCGGQPFLVATVQRELAGHRIEVEVFKMRTANLPKVIDLHENRVEDIPIDRRKALGESTAMSLDLKRGVMAYLGNNHGMPPATTATLLALLAHRPVTDVRITPFLNLDAYKRLGSVRFVRSLEVVVAAPHARLLVPKGTAAMAMLDVADRFGASQMAIKLIGDGRRGGLTGTTLIDDIRNIYDLLYRESHADVQKLKIEGGGSYEGRREIDFVRDRLSAKVKIEIGDGPSVPFSTKVQALREAWGVQHEEIETILRGPKA